MFRVIIIGAEDTNDYEFVRLKSIFYLQKKAEEKEHIIIYTNGDEYVMNFAKRYNIDVKIFNCDWNKNGKNALKIRNDEMLKDCDAIIYFETNNKSNEILYFEAKKRNKICRKVIK